MTSTFTDSLESLVASLKSELGTAQLNVHAGYPNIVGAPAVVVTPGDPFITFEGAAFGHKILHHNVDVVVEWGDNQDTADLLNEHLEAVIDALWRLPVGLGDVERPALVSVDGAEHLAVSISTTTEI